MGRPKESAESKAARERERRAAETELAATAQETSKSQTSDFRRAFMKDDPFTARPVQPLKGTTGTIKKGTTSQNLLAGNGSIFDLARM